MPLPDRTNATAEPPPTECVNGHPLAFPNLLVSHQPCSCAPAGHRVFECLTCGAVGYVPPHAGEPFGQGSAYG